MARMSAHVETSNFRTGILSLMSISALYASDMTLARLDRKKRTACGPAPSENAVREIARRKDGGQIAVEIGLDPSRRSSCSHYDDAPGWLSMTGLAGVAGPKGIASES